MTNRGKYTFETGSRLPTTLPDAAVRTAENNCQGRRPARLKTG
jgi:hypothetical protein